MDRQVPEAKAHGAGGGSDLQFAKNQCGEFVIAARCRGDVVG